MWTVRTGYDPEVAPESYILEGRKGETTRKVEIFDLESRRKIDTESTRRTVEFIKRNAKAGRPFYAYVPLTQVHFPILPHPDFAGLTGNGDFADSLAEMDHHVGTMVDAVDELGIGENTIFIFTSDNGPEEALPWRGSAGPWTGSYFTAMEGSLRVPFIVRWPGQIPAGNVNDKIVHAVDTFTTLANMAGATLPSDRIIDGVDQTDFFLGRQEASNREGFPVYVSDTLYAVKWRNWKAHFVEHKYKFDPPLKLPTIRIHDLYRDPHERNNIQTPNSWVIYPLKKIAREMEESLVIEPPIPPGTPDPYLPPTPSRR
jgi:arylsulfatase